MPHVMTQVEKVRRAAQLRREINGCHALIAYHSTHNNAAAADGFRGRLKELTEELEGLS